MKKILLLGGSRYLIPVIESIHKLGYYAVTCDYIPDNVAHKYSDEYYNISIVDKKAILKLARDLKVSGIMSFATDPGVITAAYVAQELGLPSCGPYDSVCILQNKDLFRKFLTENGFAVPHAKGYASAEDALKDLDWYNRPVIVKPVDCAGSKGITRVNNYKHLKESIQYALYFSRSKRFIIEDFIIKEGFSSDTDCFTIEGKLKFVSFSNQMFDEKAKNPFTPAAYSWPSVMAKEYQDKLENELSRLLNLLGMQTSIFNIETCVGSDGKAYIMEVAPRGGGNRLAEILRYATGVDLITNAVRASVGDTVTDIKPAVYNGFWVEIILHGIKEGKFKELWIDEYIQKEYVVEIDLWVEPQDCVFGFNGANEAIGTLLLKFDTQKQLENIMSCQDQWMQIILE